MRSGRRAPGPAVWGGVALLMLAGLASGCGTPQRAATVAPDSAQVRPVSVDQLMADARAPGARAVVLNVWATWCMPCREEIPDLLRLEREYRARGLRLVLVSGDFDTELPAVKQFLAQHRVGFLTYLKQDDDMRFIAGLDPRWSGALPATLVFDGAGRQTWFHEGKVSYDTLKTRIEEALNASTAPGS